MKAQRSEQEQKLIDDARLLRAWKNFHREELETALAGPHGAMVERLAYMLKALELNSAPLLLAYIRGVDWTAVDYLDAADHLARGQRRDHSPARTQRHVALRRWIPRRSPEPVPDSFDPFSFPRKRRHPERMPVEERLTQQSIERS